MQKKLIALAVAGLASTAAFAQSNVTLYGVADSFIGSANADGAQRSTLVGSGGLSSSRLGVKGVEDLGNGLKAVVVMEYGLTTDQNTTLTSGRQQLLGLAGDFGTVAAGRLQTTGYDWGVKYDALAGTAISPLQNVVGLRALVGATAIAARADNALAYISPNMSGLTVAVNYTPDYTGTEALNSNTDVKATLMSANYENGPMAVGLVRARAAGATTDLTDLALGGSYNFGSGLVKATYQTSDTATLKNKFYSISGVVPVSAAGNLVLGYAKAKMDGTNLNGSSYTLAYLHSLSKRTTAYAGYSKSSNDSATAAVGVVNSTVNSTTLGGSASLLVAGLNHKF
jgi:predicted porin